MAEHKSADDIRHDFDAVVNMTPKQLEEWLATDDSRAVGWSGDGDLAHMRNVVGYVHRHLAQAAPTRTRERSNGRYSLMNRGHDR